ncbi:MAG: hypothetical protein L6433_11880, partial [Actinomycetia bacterium]|nr:hypothetical protein [Actinomycetes bacterium]
WYFPEGTTRPGFEEWICVQNPNGHDAEICLELMTPTSSTFDEVRIVPKYSRTSIRINDILTGDVSVRLLSDSKVYAERSLYWADRREGHTCHGLKHDPLKPSSTWYMAEGATGTTNEFQTFVLVQNPNDQEVTITAEFQLGPEQGEVDDYPLTLPARSRGTIWLNKAPGMPGRADVSTKVTCNEGLGILAERSTYWNIPDEAPGIPGKPSDAYGGHCSPGVTSGNTEWYLAEGSTNWGFDTYVLIQNPNNKEATVNVTYMKSSGAKIIKRLTIAAKSRKTIHLNDHDQTPDSDVSTMVESSPASPSNPPVVAERAMYWDSDPETGILGPGHSSEGVPVAAKKWYLAEGSTDWGFDTYVLIQNPNEKEATVNVTYMTPSGENIMEPFIMPANSRKTIHLNDPEQAPNSDVSTLITADVRVVAERAMYWINTEGLKGGTDSVGMPEIPVWDTQTGNDVWVILSEGEVTFEEVSSHGTTVIVEGSEHRSDGPPLGYLRVCEGTYYHLATTAEHSGNIDIELNYFGLPDGVPTEYIRLLFYNEDTGTWSDITTGVDPERKVVKGTSGSTGIFCVAVPVTVEVHPETLNLNSQGRWITTYIGLPEGYDAGGIDVETVQLRYGEHVIDAQWGNVEEDGRLMVKFDRQAVSAILPVADEVELFISGEFHGVLFRASDHIRVISPGK